MEISKAGTKEKRSIARAYGASRSLRPEAVDELPHQSTPIIIHPLPPGGKIQ